MKTKEREKNKMINAVTLEAVHTHTHTHTHTIPLPNCLSRVNSVIKNAKNKIEKKTDHIK